MSKAASTTGLRIDTHAHVFARGLPMADGRRYTPAYDITVDECLARLDALGMSHGVLVQPSFLGSDNSYMLQAIARAPDRLRGIAMVEPDIGEQALLALQQGGVVGVRFNLVGGAPLPDFKGAWRDIGLVNLIAILANNDLSIGARNPTHDGRIAFERIREHVVI